MAPRPLTPAPALEIISQSSGPQTSLNTFCLLHLGRCLDLDIHSLSPFLSVSLSPVLFPAWSSFLPGFFIIFILVCWSLSFVRTLIKCLVILFLFWCIFSLNFSFLKYKYSTCMEKHTKDICTAHWIHHQASARLTWPDPTHSPGLTSNAIPSWGQELPSWVGSLCCSSVPQNSLLSSFPALGTLAIPASICLQPTRALCGVKSYVDLVHCSFLSPGT